MKNQYFGDIHDYRKYGLLRALQASGGGSLLVAWMLTPDDGGSDGGLRDYLKAPDTWACYDRDLFEGLSCLLDSDAQPAVSLLEGSGLLPTARFHSVVVPDGRQEREAWQRDFVRAASGIDLVFLDPDNGIEVPSKPVGRKHSSKYVTWLDIEKIWGSGCSILMYQHFPRKPRELFAKKMVSELCDLPGAVFAEALRTPYALFLLVAQERHEGWLREALSFLPQRWNRQIVPMELDNNRLQRAVR